MYNVLDNPRRVVYQKHRMPRGIAPQYWAEWLSLWRYRFGVETVTVEFDALETFFARTVRAMGALTCIGLFALFMIGLLAYHLMDWRTLLKT